MKSGLQFSIRNKLILLVVFMALLLVGIGWMGLKNAGNAHLQSEMLYRDHLEPEAFVSQLRRLQAESRGQLMLGLQRYYRTDCRPAC